MLPIRAAVRRPKREPGGDFTHACSHHRQYTHEFERLYPKLYFRRAPIARRGQDKACVHRTSSSVTRILASFASDATSGGVGGVGGVPYTRRYRYGRCFRSRKFRGRAVLCRPPPGARYCIAGFYLAPSPPPLSFSSVNFRADQREQRGRGRGWRCLLRTLFIAPCS